MKFPLLNCPTKFKNINVINYKIDWDKKEASSYENLVKAFLRSYWENDLVLTQFVIPGSKYRIDFFNVSRNIVIEVSPISTHGKLNPFMHKNAIGYLNVIKRDIAKQKWSEDQGFTYIELSDEHFNKLSKELFKTEFNIIL